MKNNSYKIYFAGLILSIGILYYNNANAQTVENEWQTRMSYEASVKLAKNLKLAISPELRFDDQFSLDKYQIESELKYNLLSFLSIGGSYRFIGNLRDEKSTEYLNRYQFNATFQKSFNRWEPGFKLSFTDYADDSEEKEFLRYKAFLSYNIAKSKLTPELGLEAFHQLANNDLYKIRYSLGFDYKLTQKCH